MVGCSERTLAKFLLCGENRKAPFDETDVYINDVMWILKQDEIKYKDIPGDYTKIACYKDPFKRFCDFCYIHDIPGKLVLNHLKQCVDNNQSPEMGLIPQTDYYTPNQIDMLVPCEKIKRFLSGKFHFQFKSVENYYPKEVYTNIDDKTFFDTYYQKDYNILKNVSVWEE